MIVFQSRKKIIRACLMHQAFDFKLYVNKLKKMIISLFDGKPHVGVISSVHETPLLLTASTACTSKQLDIDKSILINL